MIRRPTSLVGEARIVAGATQDLSSFNLDLDGLTVDAIDVDRRDANWDPRWRRARHHAGPRHPRAPRFATNPLPRHPQP